MQQALTSFGRATLASTLVLLAFCGPASQSQSGPSSPLLETGQITRSGQQISFRIRNLPVSSFPELPQSIADDLNGRGCVIPQSYQAHHPENVIHASLERTGSSDWAVLCSAGDHVSLLVFFADASTEEPTILASYPKVDRLQAHDLTGELGFNWGIDPASPKRVHEAQAGMIHRPLSPDHDSVADSTLDRQTVYHLYRNGAWEQIVIE